MSGIRGYALIHRLTLSGLLVAAIAVPALAQPPSDTPPPDEAQPAEAPPEETPFGAAMDIEAEHVRWFSLTFSPVHLALPFLEVTGEFRVGQHLGIAAVAGTGTIEPEESGDRFKIYEIGGQARYYALGSFTRGFMVGIEAIYLAAYDETGGAAIKGEGVTVGGYGGYKRVFSGVTVDVQVGVQVFAVRTATEDDSEVGPLININFGYTF